MFKTINGFTKESMKTAIWAGNNGKRAMNERQCLYLSEDNNKCAIGCFIPNGHEAQGSLLGVFNLGVKYEDLDKFMPLNTKGLSVMQTVHDGCYTGDVRDAICAWIDANVEDSA